MTTPDWLAEVGTLEDQPFAESTVNWQGQLIRNQKRTPVACLQNVLVALRYAPEWRGVLHFDESALRVVAKAAPPWDSREASFAWRDEDDVRTAAWMQQQGIMVTKEIAGQAVQTVARESPFHPIREYLSGLVWDGIQRIDDWLILYISTEPSDYARAVGAKWLIGAVAGSLSPVAKTTLV